MKLFEALLDTPAAIRPILAPGERLEKSYTTADTALLFTNRRLILTPAVPLHDALTYHALPYRSIAHFGIDPSEEANADAVLTLWIAGVSEPLHIKLGGAADVQALQRTLADYVLNRHSLLLNRQMAQSRRNRIRPFLAAGFAGTALLAALHLKKNSRPSQHSETCPGRAAVKKFIRNQMLR